MPIRETRFTHDRGGFETGPALMFVHRSKTEIGEILATFYHVLSESAGGRHIFCLHRYIALL